MQLYLIRHPQPDVASGVCYGQSDLTLMHEPFSLAKQLQQQLPDNITLFSSPLTRCRELAQALHADPVYDERLKEMHFGEWEMQMWSDIPRQQLDQWADNPLHYTIPGGESVAQMRQRVLEFVADKTSLAQSPLALVAHAGIMKVLVGEARRMPIKEWMALHFDYGTLVKLDWNL